MQEKMTYSTKKNIKDGAKNIKNIVQKDKKYDAEKKKNILNEWMWKIVLRAP